VLLKAQYGKDGEESMFEQMNRTHSEALSEILAARHSVKAFNGTSPDKDDIEQIIRAGLRTPFAGIPAMGKKDFRRIFVVPADSELMKKIGVLHFEAYKKVPKESESLLNYDPKIMDNQLRNAPYLIIAAERKGMPMTYMSDHSISLSYCMFGMWLKATTLKIGLKLVSSFITTNMGNNEEFCRLIGLPCGEYALDACAIGYPADNYQPREVDYPEYDSNVVWF
jgi:hypothetical protein